MKWSEAETIKFVELYRIHECLWNIHSADYKNKVMKRTAQEVIAFKMSMDKFGVEEVKQKIKNLRSTYNQEVAKIQRSKILESNSANVYVPNIKWFVIMDGFVKNMKRQSLTEDNLEKYYSEDMLNINQSQDIIKEETHIHQVCNKQNTNCNTKLVSGWNSGWYK